MPRLLLALLAALALVACGGDEKASESEEPSGSAVALAAARTVAAGSARVSLRGTVEGTADEGGSFTGEGEFARDQGRLALHFSGSGEGIFSGDTELVFDGGTLYTRLAGLEGLLDQELAGKEWLKLELDAAELQDLGDFLALNRGDPNRLLNELEAAADFERLGSERVRGVETVRYRGTVDADEIEAWIGEDGLVRRVRLTDAPADGGGTMTVTMELYDFGVEVDVEPPPAGQVIDLQELLEGGAF